MDFPKVLSTAYLPSISWFQQAIIGGEFYIEAKENYVKQSYRNRSKILSANGILDLTLPTIHTNGKQLITDVKINENEPWRKQHWQAICSAYGKSAFFLYYRDSLEHLYLSDNQKYLFEWNNALIKLMGKHLKVELNLKFTEEFELLPINKIDLRNHFHAKGNPRENELIFTKKYYQVFAEKFSFVPNLSVLDLLFNVGPISADYLVQH